MIQDILMRLIWEQHGMDLIFQQLFRAWEKEQYSEKVTGKFLSVLYSRDKLIFGLGKHGLLTIRALTIRTCLPVKMELLTILITIRYQTGLLKTALIYA